MKFSLSPARLAVLGFSVACGHSVAQTTSSMLDPVVVTATRFAIPLSEVATSVDVIRREDIERSGAGSLAELLQGLSGFEFARNGGPGTTTSFFLRGHNSVNVVVLVDGLRTPVDGIGSLLAVDIPLTLIERVEVMRGNASALYGGAANGGVVNIITRLAPVNYAQIGAGERDRQSLQAGVSGRVGATQVSVRAGREKSARLSAINVLQKPAANPDEDQSTLEHVAFSLAHPVTNTHQLRLGLSRQDNRVDYDDEEFGAADPADVHRLRRVSEQAQLVLDARLTADWRSEWALSKNRQDLEDRKNGLLRTADYSFGLADSEQTALRWVNHLAVAPQTSVLFGAEWTYEDFRTDARLSGYKIKREDLGVFSGVAHEIGPWSVQANVRTDRLTTRNRLSQETKKSTEHSALLGLAYKLGPEWRWVGNVSTGYRVPSVGEQAYTPVLLKNESFQNKEAGLVFQRAAHQFKASYFVADMQDMIAYNRGSTLTNLPADNRGLELAFKTRLGSTALAASFTWQDPTNQDTGKQLARRAKRFGSLSLVQPFGAWEWSARANYQGQRRDSDFTDQQLASYTTLDLGASYAISARTTVRASLQNATDRQYQTAYGYNAPRRAAFVSLAVQTH